MASPVVYYRVEKNTTAHAAQLGWEKKCKEYQAEIEKVRKALKIPKSVPSMHSPYGLAGFKFVGELPAGWRRHAQDEECCVPRRDTPKGKADYKMIFAVQRPGLSFLQKEFFAAKGFIMDKPERGPFGGIPMVGIGIAYGRGKRKSTAYISTRMVMVKAGKPVEGLTELTASQFDEEVGTSEAEDAT